MNICENRQAKFNYQLMDFFEAGLVLRGSEVKSLRAGNAQLRDSYAVVKDGEVFLINAHIGGYEKASYNDHDPLRSRKLLLHKSEIEKLIGKVQEKGLTLIPVKMYFKNGKAKVELALAKSKKIVDKRQTIKKREDERSMQRIMKNAKR